MIPVLGFKGVYPDFLTEEKVIGRVLEQWDLERE